MNLQHGVNVTGFVTMCLFMSNAGAMCVGSVTYLFLRAFLFLRSDDDLHAELGMSSYELFLAQVTAYKLNCLIFYWVLTVHGLI